MVISVHRCVGFVNSLSVFLFGACALESTHWRLRDCRVVPHAQTTAEKIYIMFAMLIGGFMFGIIIGSLTNIIGTNNPLEVNKQARLAEISGWLQVRNVPLHLRQDIYEYYRTMYTLSETGISERAILDVLPHTLAEPLIKHMFGVSGRCASLGSSLRRCLNICFAVSRYVGHSFRLTLVIL